MNPILGLDFGRARIGVAISDELQLLAHPLETIQVNQRPAARIAEIVREKKIDHVVAGIPKRMNGQIGPAATEAERQLMEAARAAADRPERQGEEQMITRQGLASAGCHVKGVA